MAKNKAKKQDRSTVYEVIDLLGIMDTMEHVQKKFKLAGATIDPEVRRSTCVSTGLLMEDLLLGGGVFPGGWYTIFGAEQSAKSTNMMSLMTSFYRSSVPLLLYYDAEGSTTPDYVEKIAQRLDPKGGIDIKRMFGVKDPKTGKYVIPPRVWFYPENSLEGFYKSAAAAIRKLPDKVFIDGEWWLLFDNTRENMSKFKGQHDTKVGGKYGKIAIRALDGGAPQALIIVDSYPALLSDADDDEDGNNSIGLDARGHSKHLKKLRGRLKRKHATVIGVNQLRDAIQLNGHGPKDYEPGGNALKYAADVRIRQTPRAVPHASGQLEEEASVLYKSGVDTYRYICMRGIKNKYGTPYIETWFRLWQSDPKGRGWGFDPVWDTWEYLKATGQMSGSLGKKITIKLEDLTIEGLKWLDFKGLILLQGDELKALCKKFGIEKPPKIRERCFAQMAEGKGIELFFNKMSGLDELADDAPYEEWDDKDLLAEVVELGILKKVKAKKLTRDQLLEELEAYWEANPEGAEGEGEEDDDEE